MKNILISFSVKHAISVVMIVLAFVMIGCICIAMINIDFLPFLHERNILVTTRFEGIAADEMQKLVTVPVESAFAALKGMKNLTSVTRDGISLVNIELHWGVDIDLAVTEIREFIDTCYETLPSGCSKPSAKIFNASIDNTVTLAVVPLDFDLKYCRYLVDNEIKQRFQRLEGVGTVSVMGGEKEEIHVCLDKTNLEARNLTLDAVASALASSNFEYPAGTIKDGNKEILFKTSGLYSNIDAIAHTPLLYNNGGMLKISDLGIVERGVKEKESFFFYNDMEVVAIGIQKKASASPLVISKNVYQEISRLKSLYGAYYDFVILQDSSTQIQASIKQLVISAIVGILVTFLILVFFFRTFLTSIIVSSIIPLSILSSIIFLFLCNKTINILSLSGITVGIGMVIDTSTVVIENIQKWVAVNKKKSFLEIVIAATSEVSLSSIGSSITTIVVFTPFFFLQGLLGELFGDMAVSIISSVSISCILSLTYIPALIYLVYHNKTNNLLKSRKMLFWENKYAKLTACFFRNKAAALVAFLCCSGIGVFLLFQLDVELFPVTASNEINIEVFFPDGTSIDSLSKNSAYLISELKKIDGVKTIFLSGGVDESETDILVDPSKQKERAFLTVVTGDYDSTEKQIKDFLLHTDIKYSVKGKKDILSSLLAIQTDSYIITDESENAVLTRAKQYVFNDSQIIPYSNVRQHVFTPDRQMCSRFNITTTYAAQVVRNTLEGIESCYFYENGRRIPIRICYPKNTIANLYDLENTNVLLENSYVPIRIIGNFSEEKTEKILYRHNSKNAKILVGEVTADDKNALYSIKNGQLQELMGNAIRLFVVILLLLYCVMGAQFESFLMPLCIMFALPPSFSGAFFALFISGNSININSVIALVVLFGTAVNSAIIIYEACRDIKIVTVSSIINACVGKLRAVIITTLTTVCALIPFSIDPSNTSSQTSMSIAIIGGLLLSFFVVLFIFPLIMYAFFRGNAHD